ncbi:TPA: pyrroloquinoline quinone-dependent dehydrogenase [Enterobacter hormaechei subsp. steigerwaltii]|uniref:pyrroloquinoline quinone-dependent dehydrogenase n=1 Tax=Enterobacter cloacae complex TaxID=354276 RepID=UPI0022EC7B84|nr:pyrroloquinoline quinone-dependent dehydrogenase [Enterobacter hormaechei]HAV1699415.1 pyrroloquinoline quinone-dependent dehydrogenase [Enterobacter hormaechei subsp. steigerwaltii]EHF4942276.1 pyrroloquinoline quinone-dependent dehydrogenase [Enterobacter hormaechei]EHF5009715.1 pyrroloquinoline quinone-dependent dehydrogenase [Enterobacter hormaechei]ELC6303260.1 pyrroloquinoline quinone-dependent dehydrogenase [Enterobacter hormaechei]EMF0897365.1 pyrroloquinoline quinone-dependent dehy
MHNDKHYPFIKVSMTALALLVAPLALQAQDKAAEASQGTQESLNIDAADQQAPGTTKTTDDASTGSGDGKKVASASQPATPLVPGTATWDSFHGQLNAQKYSPLTQITADNVGKLTKVWEFHTGDVSDGKGDTPATVWSATPIFANDTLYIGTPFDRLIALDPGTGKEKWHYDTKSSRKALTQPVLKNRGVSYWQAKNPVTGEACQKMVYMGTVDGKLFALDAESGKPCSGFANNGVLDLNQWNTVNAKYPLSVLQPPTVVGNHLLVGWAGKDWAYAEAPPGTVFSVNAQTGKLEWTFEAIPAEIRKRTGTANVWTHMSADEANGLVYLPVSSPSPNYWGGNRVDAIPLGTSTTALDINTGKVVWSRQWVHHDVWDYDINSAPTLMDITVDGKQIPALVQATKQGFLFVVNRLTGEDVWPIEERPVPQGDGSVQGEVLSPTQPFPTKPAPLLDQSKKPEIWKLADIVGGGQCSRLWDNLTYEGMYTPPTTKGEGTLTYPDSAGGVQWGGVAFDPQKQIAIVNTSHIVQYVKLYSREDYDNADKDSGNESGFAPQEGAPYGMRLLVASNWLGMPCWQPPFGEIVALDMHTGDVKWRRPVGASQQYGFFMPESWGSPTIGGPAVTAGGVIFIGASMDAKVRAYSVESGEELWSDQAEAPAVANPSVYEYKGRQYVAFVAGGNTILKDQVGDQVVVYALPE